MIEVKNLTKTYKTGNKALKGINIQIQDGEFVFIMGRSGSGKSTLLKLLLKELEPTSGRQRYGSGKDAEALHPEVPQTAGNGVSGFPSVEG
jgi:ABC-type multidrug transport system ATPase subunit